MPALAAQAINIDAIERSSAAVVRDFGNDRSRLAFEAANTMAASAVTLRRVPAVSLGLKHTPKGPTV